MSAEGQQDATALSDEATATIVQWLRLYEFPAGTHGDRLSLKLTVDQAMEVIGSALSAAGFVIVKRPIGPEGAD